MATKTAQKIYFVAQEFESNKYGNYQNAQIQVIVQDDDKTPYIGSGTLCTLNYQRNVSDAPERRNYYGESMTVDHTYFSEIVLIAELYKKMAKYTDKVYSQGLALNVYPVGDVYKQRVLILKAIGATQLYYDSSAREYSEIPVCA